MNPELLFTDCARGRTRIDVRLGDETLFIDTIDLASAEARRKFIGQFRERVPAADLKRDKERTKSIEQTLLAEAVRSRDRADALPPAAPPAVDQSTESELAEARRILVSIDLVDRILRDLGQVGITGQDDLKLATYFLGTSRLLDRPLHAIVQGDSSSGKSFVVETVASMFPSESVLNATHLSPRALYRMEDRLRHRLLVLGERSRVDGAEAEDATKALRELQSSGRVTAEVIVEGELKSFVVEGPVASIETTTKETIFDEDANRCLLLATDASPDQIRRVILAQADEGVPDEDRKRTRRLHWAMQRLLEEEGPATVSIPFGRVLAKCFPATRPKEQRQHAILRSAIHASAVLHRFQRATDDAGRILADPADYGIAMRIAGPAIQSTSTGEPTKKEVEFWSDLRTHFANGDFFTATEISISTKRERNRVNEFLKSISRFGALEVVEDAKGPRPAKWKMLLDVLPRGTDFLPTVAAIREAMSTPSGNAEVEAEVADTDAEEDLDEDPEEHDEIDEFLGIPV